MNINNIDEVRSLIRERDSVDKLLDLIVSKEPNSIEVQVSVIPFEYSARINKECFQNIIKMLETRRVYIDSILKSL